MLDVMKAGFAVLTDGDNGRYLKGYENRPGCMTDWYTSGFE